MTIKFYIDTKITTWLRSTYEVEAETQEEGIEKIKELCKDLDDGRDVELKGETEYLYEHSEAMTPDTNGGASTIEVFLEDGTEILDNAKTEQ